MDSITQAVLGAAVGEAVAGKKAGNAAIVAGAIAGTIPDLDVISGFFLDTVSYVNFHRGITHSIFFAIIMAPIFGYLTKKTLKKSPATVRTWTTVGFLGFFTHALLDSFTSYGTGLFEPFSSARIAISSIGIVDPFYTVPLLFGIITSLFIKRHLKKRRIINWFGIGLSTTFLALTLINKAYINTEIGKQLIVHNISHSDFKTYPQIPFNTYWQALAKTDQGYWHAEFNSLDMKEINFEFIPQNEFIADGFRDKKTLNKLKQFSKGYYAFEKKNGKIYFYDLRFGKYNVNGSEQYVFTFELNEDKSGLIAEQIRMGTER